MIASRTKHEVTCHDCRFSKTLLTMPEAKKADQYHKALHRAFRVGSAVVVPIGYGSKMTEPGRISQIWWDWEEAVVKLNRKGECFECVHKHMKERSWRGKLIELVGEPR